MEYKIEVTMTPFYHDSPNAPYFYCILGREEKEKWHNCGHGWGKTQEEAWKLAYSYYENLMLYNAQKRRSDNMTDYILEEMNKYDADGIDFISLFSDRPLGPTVIASFTREAWIASNRSYPKTARRYWKMIDGRKVYVDDYKECK